MKLTGRDGRAFLARPAQDVPAILVFGADPLRVEDARKTLSLALGGPAARDEMRLTEMSGAELRKDGALLQDAMRAQGFFPGPRVVAVADATDGLADVFASALTAAAEGDAVVVASAGALPARSKLRKLFEGHAKAVSIGIYDDPPGRDEVEAIIGAAGLAGVDREALAYLTDFARQTSLPETRQLAEKAALYKLGDPAPLTVTELEALAPQGGDADIDDLIAAVADSRLDTVIALMARLRAQGVTPAGLCIAATRHFRALYRLAADPAGPAAAAGRLRPPVFGPRRDALVRQAQGWGAPRLEAALGFLLDADLSVRSAAPAPPMAVVERTLIRLAHMGRR